jgi:hypothetical protein
MKNKILHALATFVASNYDQLKKDYNTEFTAEQKSQMPITIFMIGTFDTLLSNQEEANENNNSIADTQADSSASVDDNK